MSSIEDGYCTEYAHLKEQCMNTSTLMTCNETICSRVLERVRHFREYNFKYCDGDSIRDWMCHEFEMSALLDLKEFKCESEKLRYMSNLRCGEKIP